MLTSKEVLEKTGISRATLNNYISWGIVPRPQVLPPQPSDGAAPRIGYFADDVVSRVDEIQRLKRDGWSITRITAHFAPAQQPASVPSAATQPETTPPTLAAAAKPVAPATAVLPLNEIQHPAYLVNNRFEVVWSNAPAASDSWPNFAPVSATASPNVFRFILQRARSAASAAGAAILRLHIALARQRGISAEDLSRGLAAPHASSIAQLHAEAAAFDFPMVVRTEVPLAGPLPVYLYALAFQKATLFIYVPGGEGGAVDIANLVPQQDVVPQRSESSGAPALTDMAVLAADLQDARGLWTELPAEEFFQLVDDVWAAVEPVVRRHDGVVGRHPGEGFVAYFLAAPGSSHLWNAIASAHQVREAMRKVSSQWQLRKGWARELTLGVGIDEAQEWRSAGASGTDAGFPVLADVVRRALQVSGASRDGAIWATKNTIAKLPRAMRQHLQFGVRRLTQEGDSVLVASTFCSLETLPGGESPSSGTTPSTGVAPVAEIIAIAHGESPPGADAGPVPA